MNKQTTPRTDWECGPHCGSKDGITKHCMDCHSRQCECSNYDRRLARR